MKADNNYLEMELVVTYFPNGVSVVAQTTLSSAIARDLSEVGHWQQVETNNKWKPAAKYLIERGIFQMFETVRLFVLFLQAFL